MSNEMVFYIPEGLWNGKNDIEFVTANANVNDQISTLLTMPLRYNNKENT